MMLRVYFFQHTDIHLLDDTDRISAGAYQDVRSEPHILIDVRLPHQFEICHLPESWNIPLKDLVLEQVVQHLKEAIENKCSGDSDFPGKCDVFLY
jgi:adenylyltransferase/sulfurtransferase